MKKLILLFAIIIITSCVDESINPAVILARKAFKAGYQRGVINVLKCGTYNETL